MRYWLMKAEPDVLGIDDLAALPDRTIGWDGVRNYQARNFMRDQMQRGDLALFYHSGCKEPGVAGIVEICSGPYPDPTQFDPDHRYYDPKSTRETPRWQQVDVRLAKKTAYLTLAQMRATPELEGMQVLARGNRLSITPVSPAHWRTVMRLIGEPA
ncbi:EVE domain-containing protein [Chitinimonas koreensis]|uniref:EVE domain-containing protein n=1 Tax=Chitinimonas koreensis TaxID=356302 RepID=UPI00040B06EF|nr:EVE domain-containing protein [Chitinimonas koreensis]